MCGIVGYTGNLASAPILIEGLKRLEYRGYDSAGIAVQEGEDLAVVHRKGKVATLAHTVDHFEFQGTCGIGHTRTVFRKFRGGKGVATAFGMMVALATYPTLLAFAVFVVTVWLSHYISLGSILAAATLGVLVWFFPCLLAVRIIAGLVAVFVIVKHKSNIQRLVKGCENKIY